jgi:phosphatidate cytidylyltransferase
VPHLLAYAHRWPQTAGRSAYDPLAPVHALAWPMMTYTAVVMATFVAQSAQFEKPGGTMATIAGTVLAVAYVGLLGSFLIQMRWLDGPYHGLLPLVYLFTAAKGADTGAYTLGRIAGRHKLWPRLSPNKTVEGAVGGLIFGAAGSLLVAAIFHRLRVPTLGWGTALAFGLVVGTAAQLGDLMESMIKRDCARKDASAAVPGFGGVLDVLDSLLFAGPVAFGFWLVAGT